MSLDRDIKGARNARDENARAIQTLKSISSGRPEDIAERDRQLRNAEKLKSILDSFVPAIEDLKK